MVPTPLPLGDRLLVTDSTNRTQLFAFGAGGRIRAEPLAKDEDLGPEVSTPVVVGDLVLGQSGKLVCLEAATLKTLWIQEREPALEPDCHLIASDDRLLAFNSEGDLVLLRFDRQGATVLGKRRLCKKTLMHPTLAGRRLLVRDNEFVYCYDLGE